MASSLIPKRLVIAWAAAAVFASACTPAMNYSEVDFPRYEGQFAPDDMPLQDMTLESVKVVTFNIKFGKQFETAADELSSADDLRDADIILLQEMDAEGVEHIAERLSRDFVYYPGSVHKSGRDFGNAVLSRWPISEDHKVILPHLNPSDGRARIAVEARIESPAGEFMAYSVHSETPWLGPRARMDQARAVLDRAIGHVDVPSVVGGDYNTSDPLSGGHLRNVYAEAGFTWASGGAGDTGESFPSSATLDYVLVRKLDPVSSGSLPTEASDHRPVWTLTDFQ